MRTRALRLASPAVAALLLLLLASPAFAAGVTVTSTADSGAGSLRAALTTLNALPGPHVIAFNMSGAGCDGSGVCTITVATDLPCLAQAMTIDGYTQSGASPNTLAVGNDAVLKVELRNGGAVSNGLCLTSGSEGSTVRGLAIGGFRGFNDLFSGISLSSGTNTIAGNFLGTNAAGTVAVPNGHGISLFTASNVVGGTNPADRNVVSGNVRAGIVISGSLASDSLIRGNHIGTNAAGTAAIGNLGHGIQSQMDRTIIGGPDTGGTENLPAGNGGGSSGAGNLISGNGLAGVFADHVDAIVQGNRIGTNALGTGPIGNGFGVYLEGQNVLVGGLGAGEGNHIAYNAIGVVLAGSTGGINNRIRGNSIHSNSGLPPGLGLNTAALGIDIIPGATDGVTPNDAQDPDDGANHIQNFPVITSVTYGPTTTTVTGKFDSQTQTDFTLDFYEDEACLSRPQEFPEGRTYLGSQVVTTDISGIVFFNVVLPVALPAGRRITATAMDPEGNTSEFSQRMVLSISPISGPSAGGTPVTLNGFNFLPGAAVDFSGTDAPGEVVNNYNQMTAVSPALSPGTVSVVNVVNTDGSNGTLPAAWVADFLDVGPLYFAYGFVNKLVANLITAGCTGGNYCGEDPVTRAQMAVFLLRSKNGVCYTPPAPTGMVFSDVSVSTFAAAWIEALEAAGVTTGCGGGAYCPASPVNREQMAVFLLRMLEGDTYIAPDCTVATFGDVPCSSPFARWIYELVARSITAGCGGGNYCPTQEVTRGQMAVFLVVTFGL